MSKSLTGAKYFEALGQQSVSLGLGNIETLYRREKWPAWARKAYIRGRLSINLVKRTTA